MKKILASISIVLLLIVLFNISKFMSPNFNLANAYMYIAWVIALLLFYILLNKKYNYKNSILYIVISYNIIKLNKTYYII